MKTTVVNVRGKDPYDVYIGRASRGNDGFYGNPWTVEAHGRDEAIELYKQYFYHRIQTDAEFKVRIELLRGKVLGCFCKPARCHGDIIAEYLNGEGDK